MKTVGEINNSRSINENFLENLSKKECYVLGATALDCSVMLTFQCISDTDTNRYVQQQNTLLPVDISMIYAIMFFNSYFFMYLTMMIQGADARRIIFFVHYLKIFCFIFSVCETM